MHEDMLFLRHCTQALERTNEQDVQRPCFYGIYDIKGDRQTFKEAVLMEWDNAIKRDTDCYWSTKQHSVCAGGERGSHISLGFP